MKHFLVLIVFILLTLGLTYPAIFKIQSCVLGDHADSLLNTWIIAWDIHKLTTGDMTNFFQANIFHPHPNTLAYSEHMIGLALIGLPLGVLFNNPVLTYNVLILICLILSGWGMYLLVWHLSNNRLAALVSGLIFAYFPWRFGHMAHLQLQAAQWIPFTFLYLEKYIHSQKSKHLLLAVLFFVWQFYSCGYYGLYLTVGVLLFFLVHFFKGSAETRALGLRFLLFPALAGLIIFPVYLPYWALKREFDFYRPLGEVIHFSADMLTYLSVPRENWFWGRFPQPFGKEEGGLFLGIIPWALAWWGVWFSLRAHGSELKKTPGRGEENKGTLWLRRLLNLLLWGCAGGWAAVVLFGGFSTPRFYFNISLTRWEQPLIWFFLLGILRLLWAKRLWPFRAYLVLYLRSGPHRFYLLLLVLAVFLSFGPIIHFLGIPISYGPYYLLYKFFPGFEGLRVPARFIMIVAFSVSVWAGLGMARLLDRRARDKWKALFFLTGAVLILLEYVSTPLFMPSIPTGKEIPEVYQWLSNQKEELAVLELPLPSEPREVWQEARYVYYSVYHWQKIVNGWSGFLPPRYQYLYLKGMRGFPSPESIHLLREFKITHLIIHLACYPEEERKQLVQRLASFQPVLTPIKKLGEDLVLSLGPE